jgi:hypothetical protein
MYINHEEETSYTTRYQESFLQYVENQYCAKHWQVPVIKPERVLSSNLIPSPMASWSDQSSFDPYDMSSNDKE